MHGFSVIQTRNIDHTSDIILSLHENLVRYVQSEPTDWLMNYDVYQTRYSRVLSEQDTSVKFIFQKMMRMVRFLKLIDYLIR